MGLLPTFISLVFYGTALSNAASNVLDTKKPAKKIKTIFVKCLNYKTVFAPNQETFSAPFVTHFVKNGHITSGFLTCTALIDQ